jgi:hypothetical protein
MNETFHPLPASPFGKKFLLTHLYKAYPFDDNFLPLSLLPPSQLSSLLDLSKKELVDLIDFLGLRQLAIELKEIPYPEFTTRIYAVMSVQKQEHIKSCLEDDNSLPIGSLNLIEWDGSRRNLEVLIHQNGLLRLAKTVLEEEPSFISHLRYKFDSGRANALAKLLKEAEAEEEIDADTHGILLSNVTDLTDRFKQNRTVGV